MRSLGWTPQANRPNMVRAVVEGFSYVWREPVTRPLFVLLVLMSLAARPLPQMLPAVAHDMLHVGAIELSWLLASAGLGALIASIVSASLGGFHRRGILVLAGAAASGVMLIAIAPQVSFVVALVLIGLASFTTQLHITLHVTVYQVRTPEALRGRVVGTSSTLAGSMMAVGALLFGAIGSLLGIHMAIGIAGVALVVCVAYMIATSAGLRDEGTERDELAQAQCLPGKHRVPTEGSA
jgi:MFS family permease